MKVKFKSFDQLSKEATAADTWDYWYGINIDRVREFVEAHKNRFLVAEVSSAELSVRIRCDESRLYWPRWFFEEVIEDDA